MYYSKTHFVFIVTLSCADSNNSETSKIIMNDKTKKAVKVSYMSQLSPTLLHGRMKVPLISVFLLLGALV